ncbi:unnamed protein product [Medioppia subpectinata]|uniref:VWFC domain-containing protein n=1 Tax=Medioppia subpectinata TaxID=1979941 RepID=A0A7R9KD94_9ACAR|nr:unnamed protein product [Medioppia subpectinata]CAG2101134.1 unnamed protein product [Medioppia subpectinata]
MIPQLLNVIGVELATANNTAKQINFSQNINRILDDVLQNICFSKKTANNYQQIQLPVQSINIRINDTTGHLPHKCPVCVDRRLLQHYMARGCTPVIKGGCECPDRYECPSGAFVSAPIIRIADDCLWKDQSYRSGDTFIDEEACRVCQCGTDSQNVDCKPLVDCPDVSTLMNITQCFRYNKCCPKLNCFANILWKSNTKVCKYKGREYRLGDRIETDDRCLSCVCDERWDDDRHVSTCRPIECDLRTNKQIRQGCTPVYDRNQCCPVDYTCPNRNRHRIRGLESGSLMCEFEGRKYPLRSHLYSGNKCHKCLCQIPPQFTCTQSRLLRKRDELNQQIVAKVERINLKDFGIDRQTKREIERQSPAVQREGEPKWWPNREPVDNTGRRPLPYPRANPSSSSATSDRYFRGQRVASRRDRAFVTYEGDEYPPPTPDIPSPIDWSASPQRVGLQVEPRVAARRAFNFSQQPTPTSRPNQSKPTANCTQKCVDNKYLKHYYERQCEPLMDYQCRCPIAFQCPDITPNTTVCQFGGRVFPVGSRIPVQNPCRICECRDFGRTRGQVMAEIDCGVGIECPEEAFGLKPEPNCYFAYERDRCCGRQVCANTTRTQNQPKRDDKVCTYGGRQYRRGERIYPDEDNCKICHCDEHWDDSHPLNTLSCHRHQCELQLNRDFAQGCLPIYHEGSCCPIEYKCPQTSEKRSVLSIYSGHDLKQCWFDGRNYTVGQRLVTGNPCVSCECKAPPDFTCVQKSCPTPKHNCYVGKWDNSVCCQHYTCSPTLDYN